MGQEGWGHPWVGSVGCRAEIGEIVPTFPWALEEPRPYERVDTGGSGQKLPSMPSDEGSICRATEDVGLVFFFRREDPCVHSCGAAKPPWGGDWAVPAGRDRKVQDQSLLVPLGANLCHDAVVFGASKGHPSCLSPQGLQPCSLVPGVPSWPQPGETSPIWSRHVS